jgi:coatomer protein complex subunit alpha (xenin)
LRRQVVATKPIPGAKYGVLSDDRTQVAFLASRAVFLASASLEEVVTWNQGGRVISAIFFEKFLLFTTKNQIRYLLSNGDSGILKSVSERCYLVGVHGTTVFSLGVNAEIKALDIDLTEPRFKSALLIGDLHKVKEILRVSRKCSDSIIDYIEARGHPEIALLFAQEPRSQFRLALKACDFTTAESAARNLRDPDAWSELADEAVLHGHFSLAATALQASGRGERLLFQLLLCGKLDAIRAMDLSADPALDAQRAILLGDRARLASLLGGLGIAGENSPPAAGSSGPIESWPLLNVHRPVFDVAPAAAEAEDDGGGWGEDEAVLPEEEPEGGWETDVDLDAAAVTAKASRGPRSFNPPPSGRSRVDRWVNQSQNARVLAAARDAGGALSELQRSVGFALADDGAIAIAADALKSTWAKSSASLGPLVLSLGGAAPLVATPASCEAFSLAEPLAQFAAGKFAESQRSFLAVLQALLMAEPSSELSAIVRKARIYLVGLRLELGRRALGEGERTRQLELAAYLTHCELEAPHVRLTLQSAMSVATKAKALGAAGQFAQRLIDSNPTKGALEKAQKVLAAARADGGRGDPKLSYDSRNPFVVCCGSLTPIYRGNPSIECPFCSASYKPSFKGSVCEICHLAEVGRRCEGGPFWK